MSSEGVSNNKTMRGVSDRLDDCMGWHGERKTGSGTRGAIHGVYHTAVGIGKFCVGNTAGASAELNRAGQQFSRARNVGNSPPRQ